MIKRAVLGLVVIALCSPLLQSFQKSKQVYELIYNDIQVLKQQVQRLEDQVQQNHADILALTKQMLELLTLMRLSRTEQADLLARQKELPAQYQSLLQKIGTIDAELAKVTERLIEIQRMALAPPPAEEEEGAEDKPPPQEKMESEAKTETGTEETEEPPATTLPPNVSPQELYQMARSDYLKGNFQLAIDGFSLYKEHFSESPLADNALYWIGECYFSQQDFEEAIRHFNDLILSYSGSDSDKLAAAYLKKGISLAELGRKDEALAAYKVLITKFPLEEEAKRAQEKIKELEIKHEGCQQL